MAKHVVILVGISLLAGIPSSAAIITVDPNGSADHTTIQAAIDAAVSGADTVVVAEGTYYENISFDGKNIILSSTGPDDPSVVTATVINGGGVGSVVRFNGAETSDCKLLGFTITGGHNSGVLGNTTNATIKYCVITGNKGNDGGGVHECCGLIDNCIIIDNKATRDGGGIYSYGYCQSDVISNCVVMWNKAGRDGGGIQHEGPVERTISHCTVIHNTANYDGGGICSKDMTFLNQARINNCTLCSNTAGGDGGGVYSGGYTSWVTITNSVLWDNTAANGNEMAVDYEYDEGACWPSTITVSYSDVQGGAGEVYTPECAILNWGPGNIDIYPLFFKKDYEWYLDPNNTSTDPNDDFWNLMTVEADYHLKSRSGRWDPNTESWVYDPNTSPCVDAGDPNSDYWAEPWPNGGRINMGAYGGTAEASRGCGSIYDLQVMAADWLQADSVTDIIPYPDGDGIVDLRDYAFLALHWLCAEQ
jgi:predicted outer membrane repeat protein